MPPLVVRIAFPKVARHEDELARRCSGDHRLGRLSVVEILADVEQCFSRSIERLAVGHLESIDLGGEREIAFYLGLEVDEVALIQP